MIPFCQHEFIKNKNFPQTNLLILFFFQGRTLLNFPGWEDGGYIIPVGKSVICERQALIVIDRLTGFIFKKMMKAMNSGHKFCMAVTMGVLSVLLFGCKTPKLSEAAAQFKRGEYNAPTSYSQ